MVKLGTEPIMSEKKMHLVQIKRQLVQIVQTKTGHRTSTSVSGKNR